MLLDQFQAAWKHRHFIFASTRGELKSRFANSKIGGLWFILQPLAMAAIYTLVLSQVLAARLPGVANSAGYAIFLVAGIAAFSGFQEIAARCLTVFLEYANTLKKIAFPRIALPLIVTLGVAITHCFLLVAIALVVTAVGHYPTYHWVALPLGFIVLASFGLGLGLFFGVFNVFNRDVGPFMTVVFQLWFWMTPVVYPANILPEGFRQIVEWNPITSIVIYYQDIILMQRWPDFTLLLYPGILSVIFLLLAGFVFRRAANEIVDVL